MEKQQDLRVQKTNKALREALISLLAEKSFDDITVAELCERAMVRRATFYQHFGSKSDLFMFTIREFQREFEQQYLAADTDSRQESFLEEMIERGIQTIGEYRDLVRIVLKSDSAGELFQLLAEVVESDILRHLQQEQEEGIRKVENPELLAAALAGAVTYTMKWWMLQEQPMSDKELTEGFLKLAGWL